MMSQLDLLDLCFLTEEEKRSIKLVLQRDIDLQNNEKRRLQLVQKKMPNTRAKKKMTGEWFSSIKDHRYRGKPDGTELVWRSMTCERGSGTGLKSGQYQKEPRVPKQTDPSLERRVPLQSAIPAQLPEKNKQVVDKFGRQRRDEPVLLMKDHTANLQSEHPSLARKNPFGEADLTAGISSGTGQSDEESSEKENEWQKADPTKERDLAGMTRPLTDSKKQLAADQSEPYAHSSRQQGEVTKMKNTLALMAQQSSEDDTRQLNRILGLNDFQVPDEKIKEENKTAELSKSKISSPASDWGTGTKVGREEILQPKQIEMQKSSLPVNAQSASLAVNPMSGPEKPRRLNREMDRSGVTKAGTVNPTAAPPTSREAKPWDENFFQGEGMKGSPDCASSAAIGLPGSVEYLEGNKANISEDHKPVSGLKTKLSMDNPEFWTTPSPTDQKSELSHQGQRKALDEDLDYLVFSKKHEPLVDISTEKPSNDASTWSATPGINRVDVTEQVQKQTKSDLEYKLSPEKLMDVHSASLNPQTPEQVSMLIDFSDEQNSKPKANIIGTMSLKEKENASDMNTGPFNQDLAGIDAALLMQPIGHGIVDKPKTDKWTQREKDSISSRDPSMMSSTNLEQQKKPFWDSQQSILKDQEHHLPYSGMQRSQQMEISKTIKWDSKRSHSQDDVFNDANKFDSQQVRKGSLNDPYKIDIDPMMSQNQPPTWTEGMSVKSKVSEIERIIAHHDDGKYERSTKSNQWSDVPQRQSQEPIRSKPQTTILKSETPSIQATPVVEDLISAIKVVKKRNDAEDTLKNLYKMAAVGKASPNHQQLFSSMGQSSKPEKMTDTIGYWAHPKSPRIQQILEHNVDQTAIPFPIPELPKDLFSKSKQKNKIDRYVDEDQKRVNKVNNSAKFDEPNLQNEVPHRRSQEPIRSKPQTTISKRETPSIQPTPVVEELISAIKVEKKKNDAEAMLRNMYKMAAMGKVSPDSQPFFLTMGQSSQPVKKTYGNKLATEQKKLHSTSVKVEDPTKEKGIVPHPSAGASQSLFLRAMQMKEKDVLSEKDEKDGFENRFSKKPRETTPLSDVPQRRSQELIRSKPQTAISKSNYPSIQPTPVVEDLISAIKVEKKKNDAEDMLRNLYKMSAVGKVSPDSQQLLSTMVQSSKPEKMTDTIGYQAHPNLPTIQQILEHIADQTAIPVPIPELPKDLFSKSKQKNKIDRYVNEDQKRVNKVNNSAKFDESTLQNEVRPQNYVPHRRSQEPIRSKPQTTISKRETPSIQPTPVVEELISAIKVEKKKNDAEDMLRNLYKMAAMGKVSPDSQPFFLAMGQSSQPVKKTYGNKLATEQKKLHATSVKVEDPTKEKGIVPHPSAGASDSLFLRAVQMKEKEIVSGKDEKGGLENRFSKKPKGTIPLNYVPQKRYQEPIRSETQPPISKSKTPSIQATPVVEELISAIKVEKKKNDAEDTLRKLYKMAAIGKDSRDGQQLFSAMGQPSKMLNTSNQADDETEMSFHEKDPELRNDYSESPFSSTLRTTRDHAAATKSDSARKQGREVIADATTSSKYAGEDVRIRSASSFENEDEPPHSQTCRDPVPRTWNQQVNASPIADGQNQNRMESPAFDNDAPIAHYSQPPPVRPRMANISNVPDVDDEVLPEHASLQQRSAPRDVYDEQDSPASKMLARSKKKMSRSLDDILESNSEDPDANAEKQRKQSDEPEDVNRWVDSTVKRSEIGPAGHILAKGSNLPQAGKLSRSVPVLSPSDEEAESPDSWSEDSQMSEQMPKRFGQAFSTSSAGSISSSMMSLYSEAGDFGKLPITGEVEFALRYNERGNELLVHVSRCRDLAPANEKKKRSDAYVKTYLLPDRSRQSKRKTVIKKKTLSPKYDEVLKYKIEKSDLANRILNLSVWHNDMFGRNVFLGEVNLILNSWDWTNQTLNWYSLQPKDFTIMEPIVSRGQLTLGLKYVPAKSLDGKKPASGEIHIWIQNAYNLVPVRSQGVDSFVKCYILPDTSRQSRQKTRVVRKNCNPEYNHTMVYDGFQAEDLNEACIELTIWDYERFSTNQFLGGVRLSFGKGMSYGKAVDWMDSQGEEIRLYKKLLETPNEWNQGILPLRPQMATAQNPSK